MCVCVSVYALLEPWTVSDDSHRARLDLLGSRPFAYIR